VFTTANPVATMDLLSGGRVLFGVGAGWHPEELANSGVPYRQRYAVLRERVLALRELWSNENAEYHGEFVEFDPVHAHPKPHQDPHPPIITGFEGPNGMKMTIEWSDGWCPTTGALSGEGSLPAFAEKVRTVRAHLEEAGRDPTTYPV
jgi:alkanesulfonate monooxygenase SsuD/methylene tetrahydromethanopterin reductase-like flavin-dependent oxidoreductase (luciferase family)